MTARHTIENKNRLLQVARESLEHFLINGQRTDYETEVPELQTKSAVFVTLRKKDSGNLRGCIGQTNARYALIKAVAKTAISSAVDDPRFSTVTLDELPNLCIEINVLSAMTSPTQAMAPRPAEFTWQI